MCQRLTYEEFVQKLRKWIIKAAHLPEDYVFFKKKEKTGITANGDTTTFPQMLSKCLIGVATLLICFAVSYDQQHFLNEKELNRQIDQQKGYYHALTEQVLAEREARHNFPSSGSCY